MRWGERERERMVDQCAALALPADAPQPNQWPLPELRVPAAEVAGWRERLGLTGDAPGRRACAGRGRPVEALAGRLPTRNSRTRSRGRTAMSGSSAVLRERRSPPHPRPGARARDLTGSTCATRSSRSPHRMSRSRTTQGSCTSRQRLARRRSAFSDPRARGIGRRSIRSRPRSSRPRKRSNASRATSRPATWRIIVACEYLRRARLEIAQRTLGTGAHRLEGDPVHGRADFRDCRRDA